MCLQSAEDNEKEKPGQHKENRREWYPKNHLYTQVGTGGMEPSVYLGKLSNLSVPWLPRLYIGIIVVPTWGVVTMIEWVHVCKVYMPLAILHVGSCSNYYGSCCYYNTSTTAAVPGTPTARRQYSDLEHRFWSQTAWVSVPIPSFTCWIVLSTLPSVCLLLKKMWILVAPNLKGYFED